MTYLNILWHFHQPLYIDLFSDTLNTSIITFRTLYNYYPMAMYLEHFPQVKVTCNLTATLLQQIDGISKNKIKDNFQAILTNQIEKEQIKFFWNEIPSQIKSKYNIPNRLYQKLDDPTIKEKELSDLKVWLHLFCFHPFYVNNNKDISSLFYKGIGFNENDINLIIENEKNIFISVIEKYKNLQKKGQIEISTTPFYHPILPLVYNIKCAKQTETSLPIPDIDYSYPDDAKIQVQKSINFYQNLFKKDVKGMWPAEGSVSSEILDIFTDSGLKWIATDNYLLSKITGIKGKEEFKNIYLWKNKIGIFFRDREFSDLIGFNYQKWDEKKAAEDFINKIANFYKNSNIVLPIILDGENPWEWYTEEGQTFLPEFYKGLTSNSQIKTLTFSESLSLDIPKNNLSFFIPGTWMGHNFDNWIGQKDANKGWEILSEARKTWKEIENENIKYNQNPYELLLFAESSDFFWWMSLPADISVKRKFYSLFIDSINKFYQLIGREKDIDIKDLLGNNTEELSFPDPTGYINPVIDGQITDFFEWQGSSEISPDKLWLTFQPVNLPLKKIFYGYNQSYFFLRIDFISFKGMLKIEFKKEPPVIYEIHLTNEKYSFSEYAFDKIFELKVPLEKIKDEKTIFFRINLFSENQQTFQFPPSGYFSFKIEDFSSDWYV
jgi:alpha-amylase/alpha-mannosidase (GH57 family)